MLGKTLASFLLTFVFMASAQASYSGEELIARGTALMAKEEACGEVVDNHMQLIQETEDYLNMMFVDSNAKFTAFEITNMQKVIKVRYDHLMKVRAKFQSQSDCNLPFLGTVVAVYDFNVLADSAINNKETRRMIYSFVKSDAYGMQDFKHDYNYFTRIENIEDIRQRLTSSDLGLMEMFNLKINQNHSGSKISTGSDRLKRAWDFVLGKGLVRSWGVLSDNLKVRHGYLRDDLNVRENIHIRLKPLDLMFEQRRFVLSNLTIPGHWGHVAIWLGTKQELQSMGVWDREDFKAIRENVELGKNIIQMRKEGVVFSSLEEFMNLDEIAIMRVNAVQQKQASVYPMLAENISKKYDFSFDANSLGKITCTELVAFSFGKISWHSRTQMSRIVITPDDMAKLTLDSNSAELITYIGSDKGAPQTKTVQEWFTNLGVNP